MRTTSHILPFLVLSLVLGAANCPQADDGGDGDGGSGSEGAGEGAAEGEGEGEPGGEGEGEVDGVIGGGQLDDTIGTRGQFLTNLIDALVYGVIPAADGPIVYGGADFDGLNLNADRAFIAKFTSNGAYDTSLNGSGFMSVGDTNGTSPSYMHGVVETTDGELTFVGDSYASVGNSYSAFLGRVDEAGAYVDGYPDPASVQLTQFDDGPNAEVRALSSLDAGGIVIVGRDGASAPYGAAVWRRAEDGTAAGQETINLSSGNGSIFTHVFAKSSGGFVLVGREDTTDELFISQASAAGVIDTNFGDADDVVRLGVFDGPPVAVAHDPNGYLYVAQANAGEAHLLRFDEAGEPDTSYGNNGESVFDISPLDFAYVGANGMVIDDGGNVIVCGTAALNAKNYMVVVRVNEDGVLDGSYGHDGVVASNFEALVPDGVTSYGASAENIAWDADGVWVVGSLSLSGGLGGIAGYTIGMRVLH